MVGISTYFAPFLTLIFGGWVKICPYKAYFLTSPEKMVIFNHNFGQIPVNLRFFKKGQNYARWRGNLSLRSFLVGLGLPGSLR